MEKVSAEEVVRKFIDAYNKFDVDAMLALLHSDIRFMDIQDSKVAAKLKGKTEFEVLARQSAQLFRERKQTIKLLEADAEKVVVEVSFTGVFDKDTTEGPLAGDEVVLSGRSEYLVRDGLIVSIMDETL